MRSARGLALLCGFLKNDEWVLTLSWGSKRIDTKVSILLGLQFPLFLNSAKIGERRPLRKWGTAEDFFFRRGGHWPPLSPPLRNARFPTATHTVYSTQARLIVPRNSLPRCRRRHLRIFLCEYALSDILSTLHSTAEFTNKKEPEAKASGSLRLCAYFIMISAMNTRSVSPVLSSA